MLKRLNAFTLAVAFTACAQAEVNVVGDGEFLQVAFDPTDVAIQQAQPMSCQEARNTAWFVRELSRTDGEADPEVAYTPCGPALLAASTPDID